VTTGNLQPFNGTGPSGNSGFHLEAFDQATRESHERPSIGVLLCATKDDEVVEYALARTTSPALIAEYQTLLPPKALLRRKLHDFYARLIPGAADVLDRRRTPDSRRERPSRSTARQATARSRRRRRP
jgi:hypothetical protein